MSIFSPLHPASKHPQYRGRREGRTGFWWGNLRERNHWEDPDVNGRIILI